MKIIITGASGLLGKYLLKTQPKTIHDGVAVANDNEVIPCYRTHPIHGGVKIDISDYASTIQTLFKINPNVIIHCAANGDVDSVEKNPSEAVRSDLLGVTHLVEYCEKMNCKLVTISSNAVYDGYNPPYNNQSPRNPVNTYGKIKSLADDIVGASKCDWMIIRTMMMFGWNYPWGRGNWATKIIQAKEELKLVDDVYLQPTYAEDVARFIWNTIEPNRWRPSNWQFRDGYNISSGEKMSIFDFGLLVKEVFELDVKITPCSIKEFKIAPRPVDTCFDTESYINNHPKNGLITMKNEKT